jgi:predicted transcriptional regulator
MISNDDSTLGSLSVAKNKQLHLDLGRRERQIMDVVYRLGESSVSDVLAQLPDPPSYSAVRTMMRHLESKGFLKHRRDGNRYLYSAIEPRSRASRSALRHLVQTFFRGSATDIVAAILEDSSDTISPDDFERMARMIDEARKNER